MRLTIRCARAAVVPFEIETVEVAAVPPDGSFVWLPRQRAWVRVSGVPVFKDGLAFMSGLGALKDDARMLGEFVSGK